MKIKVFTLLATFIVLSVVIGCQYNKCSQVENILAFTLYRPDSETGKNVFITKIYDKPNGKIIFNLPSDEGDSWLVEIEEKKSDYFKIRNIWRQKYVQETGGSWANYWKNNWMNNYKYIWVKKGNLEINTRNYDGQKIPLYEIADKSSKIVGYIENAQTVSVLDACNDWAYIKGVNDKEEVLGWLEPKWQCGNPLTTCT